MSIFVFEKFVVTFFVVLINIAKRTHVFVVFVLQFRQYMFVKYNVFFANDHIIKIQIFVVTSSFEIRFSNSNALFDDFFCVCLFIFSIEQTWFFFRHYRDSKRVQIFNSIRDQRNLRMIVWKKIRRNRNHRSFLEKRIEKTKKHDSQNAQIVVFFDENCYERALKTLSQNWKKHVIRIWLSQVLHIFFDFHLYIFSF